MYKSIVLTRLKVTLTCFKQLLLNVTYSLVLSTKLSPELGLFSDEEGSLILSSDKF